MPSVPGGVNENFQNVNRDGQELSMVSPEFQVVELFCCYIET